MTVSTIKGNPLLRLLFVNGLAGTTAAGVLTAGLLLTDVGGLGGLVLNAADPVLPVVLLFIGLTITLASVAMGVAVMRLPSDDGGSGRGHRFKFAPIAGKQTRRRALAVAKPRR